ncbi:hypothetical protein JCM16106_16950 [Hydrogenophilus islandicus]
MHRTNWEVRLRTGAVLCVQPTVKQMTTYILLEQEDWFEAEIDFVRRLTGPGAIALDIGANHGVYAISMAAAGAAQVIAFEPTTAAGSLFAAAIEANGFEARVSWVHAGLSDHSGEARIATGLNTELSNLQGGGEQWESIRLLTLDDFVARHPLPSVDFVKMDVEGEERAVLRGGRRFFETHSPLVMFELKHGNVVNEGLIEDFQTLGYEIWRLVPGARALMPFDRSKTDGYLLNLFAAKPDRAHRLGTEGLLADGKAIQAAYQAWSSRPASAGAVLDVLAQQRWAQPHLEGWRANHTKVPPLFWSALLACLAASEGARSAADRVGALVYALDATARLSGASDADMAVWILRLVALDALGMRSSAVGLANQLLTALARHQFPSWPYLPPLEDFSQVEACQPNQWLAAALQEFVLRNQSFSSYFGVNEHLLKSALANPYHTQRVDRTVLLSSLRAGRQVVVSAAHPLFDPAKSINATLWREVVFGRVPTPVRKQAGRVAIVDVGASSHGKLTEPYAPLILLGHAQVTGFEPNRQACEQLTALYGADGTFRFIPEFVGRGSEATFHETNWFMTGSLYAPNVQLLERFQGLAEVTRPVAEHQVRTVALANVPEIETLDMLKIDVHGAELDVFQGAGALLDKALLVWTEVEFQPLYLNQPLFAEVDAFLRQRGFSFFTFDGIASRLLKTFVGSGGSLAIRRMQALWADAIYIRAIEQWEELPTPRLAKLALLLDLVVDAPDYCHHALTLIDRREGTRHAAIYLQRLRSE